VDLIRSDPTLRTTPTRRKKVARGHNRSILNDNFGEGFLDVLLDALTPALSHCRGAVYLVMISTGLDTLQLAFARPLLHFHCLSQEYFALGRPDDQRQYEPILSNWPEGQQWQWCGDSDQAMSGGSSGRSRTTCIRS
jgi:hypothetical protein